MKPCWLPQVLSITLALSFSYSTLGADGPSTPAAVLRASGKVQVNGSASRKTTTLFSGDTIQTDSDSAANVVSRGSSVLVMPNASVKFLGNVVELTRGEMAIATSTGMSGMADGVTVTPTTKKQSKFEVAEDDDSVVVAARQGNVTVSDDQQTSTVQEGQENSRKRKKQGGAVPAASGGRAISGKTLAILGAEGAVGVAAIVIEATEPGKKCLSPAGNKKCKCKIDKNGKEDCREDD